jgi:hypothetical protein
MEEQSTLFCLRVMDKDRNFNNLTSGRQSVFCFKDSNIDLNLSDNWGYGTLEE